MRLPPRMSAASHHLRRIDQAVVQSRKLARPESTGPMRFFQSTSKARLALGDPRCEEAILEVSREHGTVLIVGVRLSQGVQHPFDAFDDFVAMGQEGLEEIEMCLKRHLA